ncbi:MAG: radical SAM protein [Candidatus Acididesulfobacter diazotrophicus]|uniref:Radical SAM protein n=1 Tax=Candidatus Acididesulfobacter diazotrophicus TaxID=2597226 RepID=A0A519BKD8_9DELT|nr:MAG: radical SAM protein [Candidatus Acididesulfobacter diazotrophicus]
MKNNNLSIYIHVPFCKSKCNYCNFYSINSENIKFKNIDDIDNIHNIYLRSLMKELKIMTVKYYLHSRVIKTIYFGGGTPSVMDIYFFEKMINNIYKTFKVSDNAEITAEVNPESADYNKLKSLRSLGVNRLSIGAQSFNDNVLKFAGRIHSSADIMQCVGNARKSNFNNISLDLMLGLPGQTADILQNDINYLTEIKPEHISAYILSIEKGSKFYKNSKKLNVLSEGNYECKEKESYLYSNHYVYDNKDKDKDNKNYKYYKDNEDYEDKLADLYITAAEEFKKCGYNHYEISNFALNGFESRHNINYWERGEYIGLGPSASSFLKLSKDGNKDNNNDDNNNNNNGNNCNNNNCNNINNNNNNSNNKNESNDDNNVNNLEIRITNEANIIKYIDKILNFEKHILQFKDKKYKFKKLKTDVEILTKNDIINEEIFLSLRTNKGINLVNIYKYVDKEIINNLIKADFAEIYIKDMRSMRNENSIKNAINAKNIKNLTKTINIDDDDDTGADNNISKFNSISNNYINNYIRLTLKGMLISSEIFSKILI